MIKKAKKNSDLSVTETDKDLLIAKLVDENALLKKQSIEWQNYQTRIKSGSMNDLTIDEAAQFKSLINSSPDSILTLDLNNIIQFVSLTDKSYDTTQIIGRNILDFVSPNEHELVIQSHQAAYNSRSPQSYEIEAISNTGEQRWYMTKVGPIINNDQVTGLTLIARDITQRKKIEEQFEHSLSLVQATIESTADGILVANMSGKITLINKKFSEMWNIPASILELKDDEAALKFVLDQLIDPESFIEKIRELYSNFEAKSFDVLFFKDGRVFERYSQAQLVNGKPVGRVWSFRNVTEKIRAEEALQKSQQNLEQAQSISRVGSWEHSFVTGKLIWSKELYRIFELENESEDTLYESYKKRIHPDDLNMVLSTINEGLRTGKEYTVEHRIIIKNNEIKYIRGIGQAIVNQNNKVIGLKGTGQDITTEQEGKEKIKKSLLEKEILLKEIHHRVKNNLQVISSILNLQAGMLNDEFTLNVLRDSQSRIRCMSLVHELLYNSLDFSNINFADYTSNIVQSVFRSYSFPSNKVELKLEVINLYLDLDIAISCGLIINELVTNAFKYAFNDSIKGVLTIIVSKTDNNVKLIVADNGKGFPEGLDFTKTESLGMNLVLSLVSQIDGKIKLDNTNGARFEIDFLAVKKDNF